MRITTWRLPEQLVSQLRSGGHTVNEFAETEDLCDYTRILECSRDGIYDCILIYGANIESILSVLMEIRRNNIVAPVICYRGGTGETLVEEEIQFLEAGGDAFTGPCDLRLLVAMMMSATARARGMRGSVLHYFDGAMKIDLGNRVLKVNGRRVDLTPLEYRLVEALALRLGQRLRQEQLIEYLYDRRDEPEEGIIDVLISNVRKKISQTNLRADSIGHMLIRNHRGFGYYLVEPGQELVA